MPNCHQRFLTHLTPNFYTLLCLLAVVLGGGSAAQAQTYRFDFGAAGNQTLQGTGAGNDPVYYWNNITDSIGITTNGVLTNIVTDANVPSTLGLAMIRRFNGNNGNGTTAATPFPTNATRDSLFGNTEIFNSITNIFPSFKLTGLVPADAYTLTFYASRTGVADNRETGYTVEGASTGLVALNAANNVTNTVTLSNVYPTAQGEITISLAPTANNNNGSHFTYLGFLKLDAVPPQTPIDFTLEPVNRRIVVFNSVTFNAAVTGAAPYLVQWFSNDVAIPGANQFSYTIPSVTLDMNGSLFSVNVSNLAFGATSSNATLRVISDTNPPVALSASSLDGTVVTVCFDEVLDPGGASEPSNFRVNEELPAASSLSPDGKCLVLNLGVPVTGIFTVLIDFIADVSGNPIEAGTVVTGAVPVAAAQRILIDFGGGTTTEFAAAPVDDPVRYWNNLTGTIGQTDDGVLASLVTTQNLATTAGLTMIARFNGVNESGTILNPAFPTDATRDSLFGNTELFGGFENIFPVFKLTGLDSGRTYALAFYASRTGVADVRETLYTVAGLSVVTTTLNAANNETNTATVSGVSPNAAGEIQIALTPGPNNNNGNHFTYLGILAITPGPLGARFLAPTVSDGNITLEWAGTGELQAAPTVLGPWTQVVPSGANTHVEPVDPSTNRFYRIQLP